MQGEEIIISRGKTPVAKLVALVEARPERKIGMYPHAVVKIAEDFDAPLSDLEEYIS